MIWIAGHCDVGAKYVEAKLVREDLEKYTRDMCAYTLLSAFASLYSISYP